MNARIAGHAGTPQLKQFHTVNIKMFRHPKYYKELRSIRNKLDQAISGAEATAEVERATGPGLKPQAASDKLKEPQASSDKRQAPGSKLQASSHKLQAQ